MARYKLISKAHLFDEFWVIGEIYDSTLRRNPKWRSVEEMARTNPNAWELVPEEKLPENWVIKITPENKPILREHALLGYWYGYDYSLGAYYGNSCHGDWGIPTGAKEISWDQFKRLVLKEESMKEKEIVGYKLKDEFNKYKRAFEGNLNYGNLNDLDKALSFVKVGTANLCTIKGMGILDLWFEPVYKQTYPDITINGYKGEFFEGYVKFGCAKISKQMFVDLHSKCLVGFDSGKYVDGNKEIESVTIGKGTFSKEQIREIAEYYLNKK